MNIETQTKWLKFIEPSYHVLIIPSPENDEALFAALALTQSFKILNKNSTLLTLNEQWPQKFNILDEKFSDIIHSELEGLRDLIISVATARSGVKELHYERYEKNLEIFLKPKRDNFSQSDISLHYGKYSFDLIVTVGLDGIEKLGSLYEKNQELFENEIIINIHNQPIEQFGEINIVETDTSTLSEIVFDLLAIFKDIKLSPEICNNLLAGILLVTNSFKNEKVVASNMRVAAELIEAGGSLRKADRLINTLGKKPEVKSSILEKVKLAQQDEKSPENFNFQTFHKDPKGNYLLAALNEKTEQVKIPLLAQSLQKELNQSNFIFMNSSKNSDSFPCFVSSQNKLILDTLEKVVGGQLNNDVLNFEIKAGSTDKAQDKLKRLAEAAFGE
jgi:hypothetical protein